MGLLIFMTGAAGYSAIEYLFRGYTHWSMALTGGACLLVFYYYVKAKKETPTVLKAIVGACIFTIFEFFVGLIVNLWYGWHVWDYSTQPGNILGQVCPLFSFAWFLICYALLIITGNLQHLYRAAREET
ncbi:MAG: hypothetical protein Q4C25_02835 [Bacillota bacterium]|nr:hypothetical protein [Bacillota bacterium]